MIPPPTKPSFSAGPSRLSWNRRMPVRAASDSPQKHGAPRRDGPVSGEAATSGGKTSRALQISDQGVAHLTRVVDARLEVEEIIGLVLHLFALCSAGPPAFAASLRRMPTSEAD